MSRFALDLNDAGVTLFNGVQSVYREPGYAYLGGEDLLTGAQAFAHSRIDPRRIQHQYWSHLGTEPFAERRFAHLSTADLASKQLEDLWASAGQDSDELVVIVPSYLSAKNLGLLLGIAEGLSLPVSAMVDSAVACTRRAYHGAVPVHVDLSLHHVMLTRMTQPEVVQVDRVEVLPDAGIVSLYDLWVKSISEAFVQQSRFDPLHNAQTEQKLLDRLDGWLEQASRQASVAMQLESGSNVYDVEIESLTLIGAAAPVYEQIASKLRTLFHAEDVPAIQVTDRVARLPGLVEMLKARVGGEVFVLELDAAARGALARCRSKAANGKGVSLLKQLPWDQTAVSVDAESVDRISADVPSHLLFGHTGYHIDDMPLIIGSQESAGERFLELTSDMPGVSRRHCSLAKRNGQCVLEDHSRYGTFLNGHKVDGSAVIHAGDAIRIGSPGFEFQLITTDTKHG